MKISYDLCVDEINCRVNYMSCENNNININWIYLWSENSYEITLIWKRTLYESVWRKPINFKVVRNKLYSNVLN